MTAETPSPSSTPIRPGVDLDHTSFAVPDALSWARQLRQELGATPIAGEVLAEFRYLLLYIGTVEAGARIELLDPVAPGFLTHFLDKRGPGPHHVTFTVPDLAATVAQVRSLGLTVVGENYEHPPWREAFIPPDRRHGTVIQLAQSDRHYPSAEHLLTTRIRDTESFPSVSGAVEPSWWTSVWETPVDRTAILGTTHLAATDLTLSRHLFEGILGGHVHTGQQYLDFSWPSGSVRVHAHDRAGIRGMGLRHHAEDVHIGSARLGAPDQARD